MRINGRHGPDRLTKWAVGAFLSLLLVFVIALSGYAWTTVSGNATAGKEGVSNLTPRVEHLEEGYQTVIRGQERISGEIREVRELLFQLPKDRKREEAP